MKRRDFLKYTAATSALLSQADAFAASASKHDLRAQKTDHALFGTDDPRTEIWSFAEQTFAKPIYARQHQKSVIRVRNDLSQTTSVHWHGVRVPNAMDGVPGLTQKPIAARGGTYEYAFTPPDAGTFWYHTHQNSSEQLERGLQGPFIVREQQDYQVDDELVLLIKDWRLSRSLQIEGSFTNRHDMSHEGRIGNVITVNGKYRPVYEFNHNSRIRLRLINGSNARVFQLDFSKFSKATVIAVDGYPIEPEPYRLRYLSPGMRLDLVVDLDRKNIGWRIIDRLGREKSSLMTLRTNSKAERSAPLKADPDALPDNPVVLPDLAKAQKHTIELQGGAMSMAMMRGMMGMGGFWSINGESITERTKNIEPMLSLKQGKSYILTIKNETRFPHPMHLHGYSFQMLSEGKPYLTDTALLLPDSETKIAFFADNPGLWAFHCHVLGHTNSGMMSVIEVG